MVIDLSTYAQIAESALFKGEGDAVYDLIWQAFLDTSDHDELFITPENESKLWERRLCRDVGVAPTKYVDDFHGKKFLLLLMLITPPVWVTAASRSPGR